MVTVVTVAINPLAGCLLRHNRELPGLVKIEQVPTPQHITILRQHPGVQYITSKITGVQGWYAPLNLVEMGERPGKLQHLKGPLPGSVRTTPSRRELQEHQLASVAFLREISIEREGAILAADMGLGKEQPIDTPTMTPHGLRPLGSLRVGDLVFGSDGRPTYVAGVFPQGVKPVYSVEFSDGTSTRCGADHLWHVITPTRKLRKQHGKVLPTRILAGDLLDAAGNCKYHIPMTMPVEFSGDDSNLPLDPYLLGCLLGDGGFSNSSVVFSNPEPDLISRVSAALPAGAELGPQVSAGCCDRRIRRSKKTGSNPVRQALLKLGLLGKLSVEKHIPEEYLLASPNSRHAVLLGLMDTDGDVCRGASTATFNTSSKKLLDGFVWLVQSLGGTARVHSRVPGYTYKGESKLGKMAYRATISLPNEWPPVSSKKHLKRWAPRNKYAPTRAIRAIRQVGVSECVCIKVSNPDGLYLTNDFIVTHNTICALQSLWEDGFLQRPGLVCGPSMGKTTWCGPRSDPTAHYGFGITPLKGVTNTDRSVLDKGGWYYIHYDILHAWYAWISAVLRPAAIVFDEVHLLCNPSTERHKDSVAMSLSSSVERRIGLTGTPIPNDRQELWGVMKVVQPRQWGKTAAQFWMRYCGGQRQDDRGGGHWEFTGDTHTLELRSRLSGSFLRYTKSEVGLKLADMRRHRIAVDNPDSHLMDRYDLAERHFKQYLKEFGMSTTLESSLAIGDSKINIPKSASAKPGVWRITAMNVLVGLLSEMKRLAAPITVFDALNKHDLVVVFTQRINSAKELVQSIKNGDPSGAISVFGPITSETKEERRLSIADEFAAFRGTGNRAVFVATLGTAGISINPLAAASAAVFVDLHWRPCDLLQAEGRILRIGQMSDTVDFYYLVVPNTLDDHILSLLDQKAQAAVDISPNDNEGAGLCADLSPQSSTAGVADLDALCAMMSNLRGAL